MNGQSAPAPAARAPIVCQMDELTKSLSAWNVQKPPGFASASHVPYKPAQYKRPPSSLKCVPGGEGLQTSQRNGRSIDRSRPIKAVVERYASMSRPPTTPGILNLPPGTQTKKEEPPAEVTSLFGKTQRVRAE
ncbi:hypothetical protein H4Q26_003071 [Puccinia striiformis f. sp. tritici PST-130]|nr:hypothetical protein H4Q26_003071 [Puccinia striiformis f. sp. tritici PST-130]